MGKGVCIFSRKSRKSLIEKILDNFSNQKIPSSFHVEIEPSPPSPKNILIISLGGVGDVVCATPLVSGLKEKFPKSCVSFLTEDELSSLLKGNPDLNDIFTLERKYLQEIGRERALDELDGFIEGLSAQGFDWIVNLHWTFRSAVLTQLIPSSYKTGLGLNENEEVVLRGNLWVFYGLVLVNLRLLPLLHYCEYPLRQCGIDTSPPRRMFVRIDERRVLFWKDKLRGEGVREGDAVFGFVPGGKMRWPVEHFSRLATHLRKKVPNCRILVFGSKGDEDLGKRICEGNQNCIDLTGRTTLGDIPSLLSLCDHIVTCDTGLLHVAGAASIPTISICGPTLVGPYGDGGDPSYLVCTDLPCLGCWWRERMVCQEMRCLHAIEPGAVFEAIRLQRGEIRSFHYPKTRLLHPRRIGRFFLFCPAEKYEKIPSGHLLHLFTLALLVKENNTISCKWVETELELDEIRDVLMEMYTLDSLRDELREVESRIVKLYSLARKGLRFLNGTKELSDAGRVRDAISAFTQIDRRLHEEWGIFDFYNFLVRKSTVLGEGVLGRVAFFRRVYKAKCEGYRYILNLIKGVRGLLD